MKHYAVVKGREGPKIYTTWEECNQNISGFSGAVFKSFNSNQEALNFIKSHGETLVVVKTPSIQILSASSQGKKKITPIIKKVNPLVDQDKNMIVNEIIDKTSKLIVYTDGSCSHQGTTRARAGSGVYFPQLDIKHSSKVPGKQTNNRGELYAVILALRFVADMVKQYQSDRCITVEIHLDSTYVMNNLKSNNKLNLDLWKQLKELINRPEITVNWVKELAHSGIEGNEIADKLAKVYAFEKK